MIPDKALISRNIKSAPEKKQKRTFLSAIFDDGKSLKRGIVAIFFVIKFLTRFSDKKWKISEEFKNIREYLEIAERCYCATCVANLDHQISVFSLGTRLKKRK